ncbi:MAG TPA: zinc ABC transporter substrate-binding protein [Verrucomicrobiae bacterium]|nr:zinc ABC transporter substrate-binding protein [Verrucomicrobiae bacterium]
MWRVVPAGAILLFTACGSVSVTPPASIDVVAAESFWGSIAAQLGGSMVSVQSVVTDPKADPHEYESSPNDARAFAEARLVILNGAGYDTWGQKLLDANPSTRRTVLDVSVLVGKKQGDNPHFWYNPAFLTQVADGISEDYRRIDAADTAYFDQRRAELTIALEPYTQEIATIKRQRSGTPIGATESTFAYMADALGLNLTTPAEFMEAVAQGTDPPARAVAIFHDQIAQDRIKALVYNLQTSTAVTTNLKSLAAARHIPTVGISETIDPTGLTFQDWQLKQLKSLDAALQSSA